MGSSNPPPPSAPRGGAGAGQAPPPAPAAVIRQPRPLTWPCSTMVSPAMTMPERASSPELDEAPFYTDAVEIGVFGPKTDPLLEGQSAQMAPPPSGRSPARPSVGRAGPPGGHPDGAFPSRGPP